MAEPVSLEERLKRRERPSASPVMYQTWTDLLFVHWEIDAAFLQPLLPRGLTIDTWQGRAFVGIIPFYMRHIRPRGVPPLPWVSYFLEMNVRTYVHDASGTPGVWFFSLDCNQPLAVWVARALLGLPYRHARIKERRGPGQDIHYDSRRRGEIATAEFSYSLGPAGSPAEPGSLEFFLIERYLLFTVHHGRLLRAQVHHHPYPLHPVTLPRFRVEGIHPLQTLVQTPPAHVIGSAGVVVEIFGAERAGP